MCQYSNAFVGYRHPVATGEMLLSVDANAAGGPFLFFFSLGELLLTWTT
jgi:hypothetical protein